MTLASPRTGSLTLWMPIQVSATSPTWLWVVGDAPARQASDSTGARKLEGISCQHPPRPASAGGSGWLEWAHGGLCLRPACQKSRFPGGLCTTHPAPRLGSGPGPHGRGRVGPAWARMVLPRSLRDAIGAGPRAVQGSPAPSGAPRTSSACWSASTAARTCSSTSTARCWPTASCTSSALVLSGEARKAPLGRRGRRCLLSGGEVHPCSAITLGRPGGRPRGSGNQIPGNPWASAGTESRVSVAGAALRASPPGVSLRWVGEGARSATGAAWGGGAPRPLRDAFFQGDPQRGAAEAALWRGSHALLRGHAEGGHAGLLPTWPGLTLSPAPGPS